jgi:hypothetical protein
MGTEMMTGWENERNEKQIRESGAKEIKVQNR